MPDESQAVAQGRVSQALRIARDAMIRRLAFAAEMAY
jgi:hypothetical protein